MSTLPPDAPAPPGPVPPVRARTWLFAAPALAALALLYALTIPANHTEAEDCLWYAYDVREKGYHALFHMHHLLYLPVMRLIYTTVHFIEAFPLMIGVDILCAVATVGVFFFWFERGLQLGRRASLFGCLFLAFCYYFWRYAVEAEVYPLANLLMALLAWRVIRRGPAASPVGETWPGRVLTALLGTACMLIHSALTVPLAVVAVPLYLALKRRWRTLFCYGALATVLVTGAYYAAFRVVRAAQDPTVRTTSTFREYMSGASQDSNEAALAWSKIPQLAVGIGPNVMSSNYLFAFPKVREKLATAFPFRNFTKETYTARSFSPARAYFALALVAVLVGLLAFVAVVRLDWSPPRVRRLFAVPETVAVAAWFGTYLLMVGILEPENPENWVCFLPPLAAFIAVLVHGLYRDLERAWLPWVFAGLLLTHNLVNGFLIIHRPESDLFRHKATWILNHAHAGDVVFTRDNDVFSRYVRYYSPARIVNVFGSDGATTRGLVEKATAAPGGTRYLFVEVIEPPSYMRALNPAMGNGLESFRQELLPTLTPTEADDVKRLP